jgi:lysophospholipase L1-like esterase
MKVDQLRNVAALVVLAALCFAVMGELAVRAYLMRNTFYDIEMSRYGLALKIESEDPKIGHVHRPGSSAHLMDVPVQINSDGLRDDEYAVERNERRRIVFLGDSLTFGWGVEKEQSFEHLLERELDRTHPTEILNLGIGNYNTSQEVSLFEAKGLRYQPDLVVLFYFINDAETTPRKSRYAWLGHSRLMSFYWSRIKAVRARYGDAPNFHGFYSDLYRDDQPGWVETQRAFGRLAEIGREHGIAVRAIILPELHDLREYPFSREHEKVMTSLAEHHISALDLAPLFRNEEQPMRLWVARDDAHPNALAHAQIAQYSRAFLSEVFTGEANL